MAAGGWVVESGTAENDRHFTGLGSKAWGRGDYVGSVYFLNNFCSSPHTPRENNWKCYLNWERRNEQTQCASLVIKGFKQTKCVRKFSQLDFKALIIKNIVIKII